MYQRPIRSDELYHYGVKGMHWGVRRYQNPDGSLTAAGRSHYSSGKAKKAPSTGGGINKKNHAHLSDEQKRLIRNVAIGVGVVAVTAVTVGMIRKGGIVTKNQLSVGRREAERLSKIPISQLKRENTTYEKGKEFIRKTKVDTEDLSKQSKTYVATNNEDANIYRDQFGAMNVKDFFKPSYQIKYQVKDDGTTAASEQKRVEIFMQEMTKPEFREAALKQINVRRKKIGEEPLKEIDTKHTRQYYSEFMRGFGDSVNEDAKKANDMLVEAHKRHGFDAMVDDNDKQWLSGDPMIVFDADKQIKKVDSKKLNPARNLVNGYTIKPLEHTPENDEFYEKEKLRKKEERIQKRQAKRNKYK